MKVTFPTLKVLYITYDEICKTDSASILLTVSILYNGIYQAYFVQKYINICQFNSWKILKTVVTLDKPTAVFHTVYLAHLCKCTVQSRTYCAYCIITAKIEQMTCNCASLCAVCESVLRNYTRRKYVCVFNVLESQWGLQKQSRVFGRVWSAYTQQRCTELTQSLTHTTWLACTHTPTEGTGNGESRQEMNTEDRRWDSKTGGGREQ